MGPQDVYQYCRFGDLALRAMRRYPDRIALDYLDRQWTYRQMEERVSQVIQALKAAGLKRGDGMAQLTANRPEAMILTTAAAIMGMRITYLHPLGSEDDHAFILADSEVAALIVDERRFTEKGAALAARVPHLRIFTYETDPAPEQLGTALWPAADGFEPGPLTVEGEADDIVWVAYTGGTTGRPKGVVHRHRSFVAAVMIMLAEWEWPAEVRTLAATPISHASGVLWLPTLYQGGTFVIEPGFDPAGFLEVLERKRITVAFLVPTMIYVLLDHPKIRDTDLSSMELMIYGAAPMSPTRLVEAMEVFGPVFMQLYGQTEVPNCITALRKVDHDPARPHLFASCGMAVIGVQVALLDEDGNEVPDGQVGEICARGPLVMDEYWKRPEENAQTLAGGWLHTGDMARMDADGYYFIVDRAKDMIISGGFNVYPREIEDVLTTHPAISMAAIIGVPHPKWGEMVKAVIVARPGSDLAAEEVIRFVRDAKGGVYAPKEVEFAAEIPLTALGKPDKKALRAKYWTGQDRQVG
ncbi:MAG: AMP-binding protein [Sneathiellaceae bacterium]